MGAYRDYRLGGVHPFKAAFLAFEEWVYDTDRWWN